MVSMVTANIIATVTSAATLIAALGLLAVIALAGFSVTKETATTGRGVRQPPEPSTGLHRGALPCKEGRSRPQPDSGSIPATHRAL